MIRPVAVHKKIPIDENFFCDGHYAVLLSQSLGGSGMPAVSMTTPGTGSARQC